MLRLIVSTLVLASCLAGCSPQSMYNGARPWRTSLCEPSTAPVDPCTEQARRPYAAGARQ